MFWLLNPAPGVSLAEPYTALQAATDASAQALIREVWEVVDTSYMDARKSGFDHEKWARLRDAALSRTYRDQGSVHRWGLRPDCVPFMLFFHGCHI